MSATLRKLHMLNSASSALADAALDEGAVDAWQHARLTEISDSIYRRVVHVLGTPPADLGDVEADYQII